MEQLDRTPITEADFVRVPYAAGKGEAITRPSRSYWSNVLRHILHNKVAMASLAVILIIIIMSIIGPMMVPYQYNNTSLLEGNQEPSATHWFGTDKPGRDLWARCWVGARISLLIGLMGAIIPQLLGIIIGGISGYFGGWVDMVIMRFIDICSCIPTLIYLTLIMLLIGSGPVAIVIAVSVTSWTGCARMVRGRILQFKDRDFVLASRTQGAGAAHLIFRSILPNIMGQIIVDVTSAIPQVIFTEAYLSFIGLGIQSPMTSWCQLDQSGASVFRIHPYQLLIPGALSSVTILAFYLFGNCLRDAMDPHRQN